MNSGRPRAAYFAVDALHRLRRPIVPTVIAVLILFAGTTSIFATTDSQLPASSALWSGSTRRKGA